MAIAKRGRYRRRWRDPRLVIGLVLILGALGAGTAIVWASMQTEYYYVAGQTLLPGQAVHPEQVELVEINPGAAAEKYYRAGQLPQGQALMRTVGAGELVPRSAFGDNPVARRRLVVNLTMPLPAGIERGDVLNLWQVYQEDGGEELPELVHQVASEVILEEIRPPESAYTRAQNSVEVLVKDADLEAVLQAIGSQALLVAVPQP